MACSCKMNDVNKNNVNINSDNKPFHTKDAEHKTDTEDRSEDSDGCCYDMMQCQAQVLLTPKGDLINPNSFTLLKSALIENFNSNIVKPHTRPPIAFL